jgi:hypothetical protein
MTSAIPSAAWSRVRSHLRPREEARRHLHLRQGQDHHALHPGRAEKAQAQGWQGTAQELLQRHRRAHGRVDQRRADLLLPPQGPELLRGHPGHSEAHQKLSDILSERWTIADLVRLDKLVNEKKSLKDLILEMEDEVLANAGVDVFEELFKLIFTKLYDEIESGRDTKRHLVFKNYGDTETELKAKIQDLFDKAREVGRRVPRWREDRAHPQPPGRLRGLAGEGQALQFQPRSGRRSLRVPDQQVQQGREGPVLHAALRHRHVREDDEPAGA